LKTGVDKLKSEIAALEKTLALCGVAPLAIRVINDPEEGLDEYRGADVDETKTIEIGTTHPDGPGKPWVKTQSA
jgi:hypothetical protein